MIRTRHPTGIPVAADHHAGMLTIANATYEAPGRSIAPLPPVRAPHEPPAPRGSIPDAEAAPAEPPSTAPPGPEVPTRDNGPR